MADNVDFLYDLGSAYYSTYHPDLAVSCALQIIQLTPDYLEAYYLLGLAYTELGDFEKSRRAWEHVLAKDPADSVAIQSLKELEKYLKK